MATAGLMEAFLESFDVFQSVDDPSADLQKDGACLGPSPSFKCAWRDTLAAQEFGLVEKGNTHVVLPLWLGTAIPTSEITARAGSTIAIDKFCDPDELGAGLWTMRTRVQQADVVNSDVSADPVCSFLHRQCLQLLGVHDASFPLKEVHI
jgi:hypothetical protein